ncbi:MAG: PHP domain-containing protein [Desulfobacterales bacterium]|nr:PHP domain-containing protein [Desulfobacterales bacterium]
MLPFSGDLHNHTAVSDGAYQPSELIKQANQLGIKAIGVTDHDTFDGLPEAILTGNQIGIQVVCGVEVTLCFKRPYFTGSLHVLVYFNETWLHDAEFTTMFKTILNQGRGKQLVLQRVTAINEEFGPQGKQPILKRQLYPEEVLSYSPNITRKHFFQALSEHHGFTDRDQLNKIISNDSPAYIPSGIEMHLLSPFLKRYPVIAVLAHPAAGSFPGKSHYSEVLPPFDIVKQLLPEFLNPSILGIHGLEVYYPGHTDEHKQELIEIAHTHDLIITGGSDCHDSINRPLGINGVDTETLEQLLKKLLTT